MNKFFIGSSTAAHQVEGNNIHSDYWAMEHMKYTDFTEPSGDACDHYNRYKEDIALMKKAGLNAYRFSIEWARIEPQEGVFDQKEIEHYKDVILTCKENDIEPIVTLHHFTSPLWLIKNGGWENEKTIEYFGRYANIITKELGQYLNYVCTINEANMGIQVAAIAERYKAQMMKAQMAQNVEGQAQVGMNFNTMLENMKKKAEENAIIFSTPKPEVFVSSRTSEGDMIVIKSHLKAKDEIKKLYPNIKVGITLSLHDIQTLPGGEERAKKEWDDEFAHYIPYLLEDDFIGVQNYSRTIISELGPIQPSSDTRVTQMGYELYPEALGHVIERVYKETNLPILVTENGIATNNDDDRCYFIDKALQGVKDCLDKKIPVIGYMHWSFIDNFEWQKGFSMTFGLVKVDRKTQTREGKKSLYHLGEYTKIFN